MFFYEEETIMANRRQAKKNAAAAVNKEAAKKEVKTTVAEETAEKVTAVEKVAFTLATAPKGVLLSLWQQAPHDDGSVYRLLQAILQVRQSDVSQ